MTDTTEPHKPEAHKPKIFSVTIMRAPNGGWVAYSMQPTGMQLLLGAYCCVDGLLGHLTEALIADDEGPDVPDLCANDQPTIN